MEKIKRIEWVDKLKAVCMLLVIVGHFSFYPQSIATIYGPFLLTGFLFASGYTFHLEDTFKTFFIKKVRTILIPMLWMGSFTILSRIIFSFNSNKLIMNQIIDFIIQIRGRNDELWFLACLFGSSIVFYIIIQIVKDNKIRLLITFFMSLIGIIYTNLGGMALPWHIQMYGIACFILALGYIYREKYEKITEYFVSVKSFLISVFVYLTLGFFNFKIFKSYGLSFYTYGNSIIMFYLIIISSIIMITLFVKILPQSKALKYIGKNTLLYYGLHGKILSLLTACFIKLKIIKYSILNNLLVALLGLIIACIILWPITYVINRYMPFLIGKTKNKSYINNM